MLFRSEIDGAIADLGRALGLLKKIAFTDTEDRDLKVDILIRQGYLVELMIQNGDYAQAQQLAEEVSAAWQDLIGISSEDMRTSLVFVQHLINLTRLSALAEDKEAALRELNDIQVHLAASRNNMTFSRKAGNMLVEAAFYRWEMSGELPDESIRSSFPDYDLGRGWARACMDAGSAVRMAVMLEQPAKAEAFADYLLDSGYQQADFMRICKKYDLCAGQ